MSNKRLFLCISAILIIYVVLKGCWFFTPRLFETLELQSQDSIARLVYAMGVSQDLSADIVYVDIDDKSLPSLPFSPDSPLIYEKLFTILNEAGVSIQLVDIAFIAGSSSNSLAKSNLALKKVYLPLIFSNQQKQGDESTALPESEYWQKKGDQTSFPAGSPILAMSEHNLNAAGLGHINTWPDYDGVYRRVPLFLASGNQLIPALSLRAVTDYLQVTPENIKIEKGKVSLSQATFPDGRTKDIIIPYNNNGKSRINFIGPWPHVFAHYSIATILEKGASEAGLLELQDELEGAFVIVSDVTTGGRDFGPVPFSSYSPLSGLHAQFVNSILTDSLIVEASPFLVLLLEFSVCLLLIFMAIRLKGYQLVGTGCIITFVLTINLILLFAFSHFLLPMVLPISMLIIGTVTILLLQFIDLQQEKRVMRARLTPYFAPSVMEKILSSPEILSNVSKKKLTILFSDIVAFTAWSSEKEAQEIHETLNRYFQEMSRVVFAYEGTIDKFMGDGMLAFFGDPTPHEDHAQRAVLAGLAMQKKAWELKKEWSMTGGMKIRIRIGIHCGEVVVGDMGSRERMDYTVIGSHVNLAQRLEGNCQPDRVLISKEVYQQLDDCFITSVGGTIQAKGFNEPVEVFYVDRHQPNLSHTI